MRIPKAVRVFGQVYTIHYKTNLKLNKVEVNGFYDPNKKQIFIEKTLSDPSKLLCFLHEINHAVLNETGIQQGLSSEIEEAICEAMAKQMSKFF